MLRADVEERLRERNQEGLRVYPAYEDYCFGNVPGTLTSALGEPAGRRRLPGDVYDGVPGVSVDDERDVDVVIVFLVDGFGLTQWRDHDDHPVVDAVQETATVTPLTSVYPSETAAAITTFNTGVYPAEHGALGWNVYDPAFDASFRALDFERKAGADISEYDVADVFPVETLYPALDERGVDCRHVNPLGSAYDGTTHHQYEPGEPSTIVDATTEAVRSAAPPSYVYVYLPQVDHSGHADGTTSAEYAAVVDETWTAIADAIAASRGVVNARADLTADDVLVAFAADHGHVDTDPERNVDLTEYETIVDGLERYSHDETPVYLSGSPRNVQLHVRDEATPAVRRVLEDEVGAFVMDGDEVLDSDLFGDGPCSPETERRVGDLVCLHPTLGTWFGEGVEPEELFLYGMHGGLHPDEMLVPFGVSTMDAIADALP